MRDLAAAQRGLIVQRVLVDGWSPEEAGAPFGIDERRVMRWVAAYRRHGMVAIRGEAAVERRRPRWVEFCLGWIGASRHGGTPTETVARLGGVSPAEPIRRERWN
ncbi:MAG: helix-turn-helix domain-containing protein [Alphaproteobacteria bacterium]